MKLKPILIATAITAAFAAVGCQDRAGGGAGADRPSSTAPGSAGGTPGSAPGGSSGAPSTQPGGSSSGAGGSPSGSDTTPGSGK